MLHDNGIASRKQAYLDFIYHQFQHVPFDPVDGRLWSLNYARLCLNRQLDQADYFFQRAQLTRDKDFTGIRFLKTLLDFQNSDRLTSAARTHLQSIFLDWPMEPINLSAGFPPHHTENHDIMMLTIGLFIKQFRDENIHDIVTEIARSLAWRYTHGFMEWNSPRYQLHYTNPLFVLIDHAPNESIRRAARDILDLVFTERALLSVDGYLGGPFFRSWDRHPLFNPDGSTVQRGPCAYFDNNRYDAFLPNMYLAFNQAEPFFDYEQNPDLEPAGNGYGCRGDARLNQDEGMFMANSSYEPAPPIIELAHHLKQQPEMVYQGARFAGWPPHDLWPQPTPNALLYYYNTPYISMGSLQGSGWSHQTRNNNIMFAQQPQKNLRVDIILADVFPDRWRHERRRHQVQHRNLLFAKGQLITDGGITPTYVHNLWTLYQVGKGLAAHYQLHDNYHLIIASDCDKVLSPQLWINSLPDPRWLDTAIEFQPDDQTRLSVQRRDMTLTINDQPRQPWYDKLHQSTYLNADYGQGPVTLTTPSAKYIISHEHLTPWFQHSQ